MREGLPVAGQTEIYVIMIIMIIMIIVIKKTICSLKETEMKIEVLPGVEKKK